MRLHPGVLWSHSVPVAGVVGPLGCALGTLEGPRDHCVAPPTRSSAPAEPPASARGGGPGPAGCDRGGPVTTAASWLARHTRDAAALAPTANRQPLDPTLPGAGPTIHYRLGSSPHHRHGHQQSHLGLPPHHRRTRRTRSPRWSLHCVENPQTAPHRPRPAAHERDLDPVPALPGRRRLRLRNRRHSPAAPLLPTVLHRHHHPRGPLRRHHNQPDRRMDHPSRPQPVPASPTAAHPHPSTSARPRQPVHRRLRRDLPNRGSGYPPESWRHRL